jgi:hypothetical protein
LPSGELNLHVVLAGERGVYSLPQRRMVACFAPHSKREIPTKVPPSER